VLQTANNHGPKECGPAGASTARWPADPRAQGLPCQERMGTPVDAPNRPAPWATLTPLGRKAAHRRATACLFGQRRLPDPNATVALRCFWRSSKAEVLATIASPAPELGSETSMRSCFPTPHWGIEYSASPTNRNNARSPARAALRRRSAAVTARASPCAATDRGLTTRDGRPGFIAYSMGNFICVAVEVLTRRNSAIPILRSGFRRQAGSVGRLGRARAFLPTRVMPLHRSGRLADYAAPRRRQMVQVQGPLRMYTDPRGLRGVRAAAIWARGLL